MIIQILVLMIVGGALGLLFGDIEAAVVVSRRRTGGKKLPHAWLLLLRVCVCLGIATGIGMATTGLTKSILLDAGIMFVALTQLHRLQLNNGMGMPLWYFGPVQRTAGDSVYDTMLWQISEWGAFVLRQTHSPQDVFKTAMILEMLALVGLIVARVVGL